MKEWRTAVEIQSVWIYAQSAVAFVLTCWNERDGHEPECFRGFTRIRLGDEKLMFGKANV